MTIEDLFYLVKPAPRTQAPKLLEAIRSLKCIEAGIETNPEFVQRCTNGVLSKASANILAYNRFCFAHKDSIEDDTLNFNNNNLAKQIPNECIYDTDRNNSSTFGGCNENEVANCVSLITRIDSVRRTGILEEMFGLGEVDQNSPNVKTTIDEFLAPTLKDKFLLRIGFESVDFESQAREIAANAIEKCLLEKARQHAFRNQPIVFLDEAHQFLNKKVVDEYFASANLSAFNQIVK